MHLSLLVAKAAVHSKAMILLLLVHYLLLLPLFVGVLCLVLVLLYSTLGPSSFAIIMMPKREKEREREREREREKERARES